MAKNAKENIRLNIPEGVPVEKILKKFKRLCDSYGIVREYRNRQAYDKPSIRAKEKREAAEKRRKKTASKNRGTGRRI